MPPDVKYRTLTDFDAELSAMSPDERIETVRAVKTKSKIIECLSNKAPFSLVEKFAHRAGDVAQFIEERFSPGEKARLAHALHRFELEKELEAGVSRAKKCFKKITGRGR